jgi:hypothetical protein
MMAIPLMNKKAVAAASKRNEQFVAFVVRQGWTFQDVLRVLGSYALYRRRDLPSLKLAAEWMAEIAGDLAEKVRAMTAPLPRKIGGPRRRANPSKRRPPRPYRRMRQRRKR